MNLAIGLSKKNIGNTGKNPSVGCVIVKNNIIISTGITSVGGAPHAEQNAVNDAIIKGKNLAGSTIYVTLEPCNHFGKTSPCVDLIIKYKIKKVIIATIDPDSRMKGSSVQKLLDGGIEVKVGLLEKEAKEINKGFFWAKNNNRPFVTLKMATTMDGKIATKTFDSKWITNEKSRKFSHLLRSKNAAIIVGGNSFRKDNSKLNCRIEGLENQSPKVIIMSNDFDTKIQKQLKLRQTITYIASSNKAYQKLENQYIKLILCKNNADGLIDIKDFLEKLLELEINNLLVEGGGFTASQFLKAKMIDQIILFQSGTIIGSDGVNAIAATGVNIMADINKIGLNFFLEKIQNFDNDIMAIYSKNINNLS